MASVHQIAQNGVQTKWPASSRHDTTAGLVARRGYLSRLAGAWKRFAESAAPVGYEDETGFHYGDMPDQD